MSPSNLEHSGTLTDAIDYALAFARMTEALIPYWHRQESMSPEQAIRKLIHEHDVMLGVLSDIADGADIGESPAEWAKRVVEGIR